MYISFTYEKKNLVSNYLNLKDICHMASIVYHFTDAVAAVDDDDFVDVMTKLDYRIALW